MQRVRSTAALFGWDIPPGPEEAGGYSIAMLRGKPVAGLGPAMNPGPPVWATYVIVDSADAAAKKVKDNGGTAFVEPMDVLDAGRMGVFADPQRRGVLRVAGRGHARRGHRERTEQLQLE